jgi:hypothetical protein
MLLYRFAHIALLAGREVRLLCSALRVVCWHVGVAVSVVVDVIWTVETRQADNDSDDTTNVYHHHHHIICMINRWNFPQNQETSLQPPRKTLDLHVAPQGSRTRKVLFRISPTCRTKRKTRLTPGFLFEMLGESSRKEKLVTLFREQGFPRASVKLCLKFMCTQRPSLGWSRYSVHYRSVCRTQKRLQDGTDASCKHLISPVNINPTSQPQNSV